MCRGMVTIWKPKVTPMSELTPEGGVCMLPASTTEGDAYIQRTSLAANKPVSLLCVLCCHFSVCLSPLLQ